MNASRCKQKQITWTILGGLLLPVFLFINACSTPQLRDIRARTLDVLVQTEMTQTPFYSQKKYQCGPAVIATVLKTHKKDVNLEDIISRVYSPGRKGSLQTDMITSVRRYGLLAYKLRPAYNDLLTEVSNGTPVVVLQNLGVKWIPKWHYAVVVGYNLKDEKIILRSGKQKRRITSMKLFERTWKRSGYWGFVVVKPGEIPATAEPLPYVNSILGLEKARQTRAAQLSYQAASQKWPNSLLVKIGLANLLYRDKQLELAEKKYRQIITQFPEAADAYNNLASLLLEQNRFKEARQFSTKAVKLGGKRILVYQETLADIRQKLSRLN